MEKFHQYTYGRNVCVESDHKPLEIIYKKPLFQAPKRLQRMLLRLQRYTIEINYKPGRYMYIADTLSRAYLNNGNNKSEKQDEICHVRSDIEMELENINMGDYLAISAKRQKDIADATMKDPILLKLIDKVAKGWTEINIQQDIAPYYHPRRTVDTKVELFSRGPLCNS
ncbi:unnamed protein product [Mytilus coruscus]|uniref:Reverse transcriptase RNase H-like domain-containing protein n=1 Tax=Mytilus coruscus TaxID=42192 RepID=A0A6J8BWN5_MYTCO|nr:unnamed protein product [Mytilus coruscus]